MTCEADLNVLLSNVLNENRFKHCRLCLQEIQTECFTFDDFIISQNDDELISLKETVAAHLGNEIYKTDIPGVDAVCPDCYNKVLGYTDFIQCCRKSTEILHKMFGNLFNALETGSEVLTQAKQGQKLYIMVSPDEAKINMEIYVDEDLICNVCNHAFQSKEELLSHNLSIHEIYFCDHCPMQFVSKTELSKHMRSHIYKCPNCDHVGKSKNSLQKHTDKRHTKFVCKDCGAVCEGLKKLLSHENSHGTKSYCPKCHKCYLTKAFYEKHVKLCFEDKIDPHPYRGSCDKRYCCQKCGKGYSTKGGLSVHMRFVHGNAKHHECNMCGKMFTAPSYLKTHLITHTGEKNFKCTTCYKNFVTKEALLYHTRRHTGEKPYSCKLCNEKFVNASARAEHIKFKHTDPKLTCDICNRKFYTANFLRLHKNRHEDPSSKLYMGRNMIPPNMPGEQNMRRKIET